MYIIIRAERQRWILFSCAEGTPEGFDFDSAVTRRVPSLDIQLGKVGAARSMSTYETISSDSMHGALRKHTIIDSSIEAP